MSLAKAIETARSVLDGRNLGRIMHGWYELDQALAALPEPMTEKQLISLLVKTLNGFVRKGDENKISGIAIRALKSANILYISEGK